MNLCQETIDGIYTHTWGFRPKTPEAKIVQYADKIAYINHDIEDSIRAGIISESDLPDECKDYFTSIPSVVIELIMSSILMLSISEK